MNPLQFILLDLLPGLRQAASTPTTAERSSAPGSIYQGDMPPNAWILREQQAQQQQQGVTRERADDVKERGNDAFKRGDYQRAITLYTECIGIDGTNPVAFTNRALAYMRVGNNAAAAEDCRVAIRLDARFFKGHLRLGQALMAMNEFGAALDSLAKAAELTQDETFQREIKVLIAKCESKIARTPHGAPATPDRFEPSEGASAAPAAGLGLTSATVPEPSTLAGDELFPISPFNWEQLGEGVNSAAGRRRLIGEWQHGMKVRRALELTRCVERENRVKELLHSASMEKILEGTEVADRAQQRLRDCVKCPQGDEFQKAVRARDEAFENLWKMSSRTAAALDELAALGAEEEKMSATILQEAGIAVGDDTEPIPEECASAALTEMTLPTDAEILHRHGAVSDELLKLRSKISATDAASAAFCSALREEQAAFDAASPHISEFATLTRRIAQVARIAARGGLSTTTLITPRLGTIESLRPMVQRILTDAESFRQSNLDCQRYLEEEARLETERLQTERRRIQLQAEVEWLKVKDESSEKIQRLQSLVQQVRTSIDNISLSQREIQRKILKIVESDHPELAWKAAAGGSQIMRWVKGSGLWVNHSIFDYEIVSTLSSTVNGKVYHAKRRGQDVALKEILMEGEKARRRFKNEVNIMVGASNHPNVVKLRGVFFDGPFAYIEMPFCKKGSLKGLLGENNARTGDAASSPTAAEPSSSAVAAAAEKPKPLEWWKLQEVFRQITSGLASIHDRGVIHADIKPSNILLGDDGTPMITDFGIAKDIGRFNERADLTQTQTLGGSGASSQSLQGTMSFMAPEMQLEARQPSTKTDIWSLGTTFYVVAAANALLENSELDIPPYPVLEPNAKEVSVPIELTGGNERLADLIRCMLNRNPEHRPQANEILAHPYFVVPIVSDYVQNKNLVASDEKIQALRAFLHVIRASQRQPTLISISRQQIVASVCSVFDQFQEGELLRPLMVVFQGEQGIDEGALLSEMFTLFFQELVIKEKILVAKTSEDGSESDGADASLEYGSEYTISNEPSISEQKLVSIGKALLKCIVENRPLPLRLNVSVLKYLVGVEPTMQDLESFDKTMAHSLKRLMMMSKEDLEASDLDFSEFPVDFMVANDATLSATTPVTTINVHRYVQLKIKYELVGKREKNLSFVKKGFMSASLLEPHLRLLSATEIMMLLCGQQHLHPTALIQSLDFQGFPPTSNTPRFLAQIIQSLSQNNLRRFLRLCTGGVSIPINGLSRKIKVLGTPDTSRLPVGHGCVYQLDLPDYNDLEVLRERMALAFAHVNDGFHIA